MYIKEIELKNFRNYEDIKLDFHEKINIFVGNNAQGKTNLIEGVYVTSFGRSFRSGKDNQMIKFGEEFCKSKVYAVRDEDETSVVEVLIGESEKGVKVNGVKIKKMQELLENILIVVFSPDDLKIVKGDPEKRRRFMDRELSQIRPSYYSELSSYRKIISQRNALLKEKDVKEDVLEVWDEKLIDYGVKIIDKRKDFIEKINRISKEIHSDITNRKEDLKIIYDSYVEFEGNVAENFKLKLEKNRKKEMFRGSTETGPHRDDLKIISNGIDIVKYGSQGQQRTAALSLKLAELKLIKEEKDEEAILLLDDVLSELDKERQNYLINSLENNQIFITTTDISDDLKEKLPKGYTFTVKNGIAERISFPL